MHLTIDKKQESMDGQVVRSVSAATANKRKHVIGGAEQGDAKRSGAVVADESIRMWVAVAIDKGKPSLNRVSLRWRLLEVHGLLGIVLRP